MQMSPDERTVCLFLLKRLFDELTRLHRRPHMDRHTIDVMWNVLKRVEYEVREKRRVDQVGSFD